MPDMSEKKSPPQKEKPVLIRTPQSDNKALKRKLLSPDLAEDEDKKVTPKRKRSLGFEAGSPDPGNTSSPRGSTGNVSRLSVPLSERQQMAMLMRMTDESLQGDSSPKPSSPPPSVTSTKRSQADKKLHKRNERGETPLHLAAKRGDVKQAKKLIKAGASVNASDYAGWTPLHEACNSGNLDVAKLLIKAGASVNVLGLGDETPLHDAAANNHSKLVSVLLKHGANPLQPNVNGQTPLDVANDLHIKRLLRREIISSNSETSSIDEVRSPTSPESLASVKDEDRGIDVEELKPRSSSLSIVRVRGDNNHCTPGGIGESRRFSLPPKSPVDKTASSPRLFLKFKSAGSSSGEEIGSNQSISHRKSTDSKEPMYKSYILTMDTGEQQSQQQQQSQHHHPYHHRERGHNRGGSTRPSPACSPASSIDVDLLDSRRSDAHPAYVDYHSNSHKHKPSMVNPWDTVVSCGSSGGGGSQHSVYSASSTAPPVSSAACFSTQAMLKVQRVRPDSSEEELNTQSSRYSSFQRVTTEPFTPRELEEVSDEDMDKDRGGNVFEEGLHNSRVQQGGPPRLSPKPGGTPSSVSSSSSHHNIPSLESINSHSPGSSLGRHSASHQVVAALPPTLTLSAMEGMSSYSSRTAGVSSTTSGEKDKDTSLDVDRTLFLMAHKSRQSNGGSSSSGSISFVNSGMMGVENNVSSTGVNVSQTNTAHSYSGNGGGGSAPLSLRWDSRGSRNDRVLLRSFPPPPMELFSADKSDGSAASPLRMDVDENLSERDSESRPLKVPPLKIILPQKASNGTIVTLDQSKSTQSKPALPYVLNTAQSGTGEWTPEMTDSGDSSLKVPAPSTSSAMQEDLLHVNTPSPSRPSRPSSCNGTGEREEKNIAGSRPAHEASSSVSFGGKSCKTDGKEDGGDKLAEQGEDEKGEEEETKPTRTLRSHTAMKHQQEQKHHRGGHGHVHGHQSHARAETIKDVQDKGPKGDAKEFEKDEGESASEAGLVHEEGHVHPRKRKLRPKTEAQSREPEPKDIVLEKPPNPYELYLNLKRQQLQNRHKMMCSFVTPKPPNGFKDYLMVNCTYVLQGNATSTLSVPMLTPPNSVTGPMRELFLEQEKARYRLRLQHHIEREKLMLAIEQEILREHARAARAIANLNQPLSVCTILCEEEIYNLQELDQVLDRFEDRDKSSRSRYNGRQFLSWLQDVGDKYDNIKSLLLMRHHHEAESLHAVQKMDWEWKLKECGQCDYKSTPIIDEVHLPMVQVNDDFELLPPQRMRPS